MVKYFLFFAGILTMCVPDDASLTQLFFQGMLGLSMVLFSVIAMIKEEEAR